MINLLPEKEQKEISNEYRFRVIAVAIFSVVVIAILLCVILTPTYIMTVYKKIDVLSRTISEREEDKMARDALDTKIQAGRKNIKALAISDSRVYPTKVISAMVEKKTSGIKISNIDFGIVENSAVFKVQGVARDRTSLVSFTDSLKLEPTIKSVEVPVSNFAKDSNIQFTFTVIAN